MTVLEIIRAALRCLRGGPGRTPGNSEQTDALWVLNAMLEAWNIEKLCVFGTVRETFTLTPSTQSYTIGPNGDVNTGRPARIDRAGTLSSGSESPLAILDANEWAAIALKSTTSSQVSHLYYDPTPVLGTLYFWPVPTEADQVVLYAWRQITGFTTSSEDVEFPPGYAEAIYLNLAIRMASQWDRDLRGDVAVLARQALARIKSLNSRAPRLASDAAFLSAGGGRPDFNFRTGQ